MIIKKAIKQTDPAISPIKNLNTTNTVNSTPFAIDKNKLVKIELNNAEIIITKIINL